MVIGITIVVVIPIVGANKMNKNSRIVQETKTIVFLEGTNSKKFVSVLEITTGISGTNVVIIGDSVTFARNGEKYCV